MMKAGQRHSYFVTSTGTDVGKTFVTAGLIRSMLALGWTVDAVKPLLSGFDADDDASWPTSDPGVLLAALGRTVSLSAIDSICRHRFAAPLSPDMAAARESRSLSLPQLVASTNAVIDDTADVSFVEGVGGVMVPIDDAHTVADWCATLEIPAILVVRGALGTLSHTLSAVEALAARGVAVAAVVINSGVDAEDIRLGAPEAPTSDETKRSLLAHLPTPHGVKPLVFVLPADASSDAFRSLALALMEGPSR